MKSIPNETLLGENRQTASRIKYMISKNIIEAKFKRSGIKPKNTFLWREMPSPLSKITEPKLFLLENEEPIVCYISSLLDYVLIFSNLRIIHLNAENYTAHVYSSVKKVSLNDLFDGTAKKTDKNNLRLELSDGSHFEIELEQGTWPIMYNILKLLVSDSKNSI